MQCVLTIFTLIHPSKSPLSSQIHQPPASLLPLNRVSWGEKAHQVQSVLSISSWVWDCPLKYSCSSLNGNVLYGLRCLSTWSLVGGNFGEGLSGMLLLVCHGGTGSEVAKAHSISRRLSSASHVVQDVNLSCCSITMPVLSAIMLPILKVMGSNLNLEATNKLLLL